MSYGTFTVSSAPGFGRQQPANVPSSRHFPPNVASRGPYDTEIATTSLSTSHLYGSGSGEKLE